MSGNFTPPRPLNTAVLFLVFNRPDTTSKVFEAIRQAKPPRLYVAADGARAGRVGEAKLVAKVREIATAVDWPCELRTLFRDKNLGCKFAVSGAITWFFEQEEQGIILEDDCLPSQSFFWFCEKMLEIYKYEERIFIVSGYNRQNEWKPSNWDYFFSHFGGIWGWASWRRAWQHYDIEMDNLEKMCNENYFVKEMGETLGILREQQLVSAKEKIMGGELDTWDFQWALSRHFHDGLACVPSISLICNIGFDIRATHTFDNTHNFVQRHEINFPLSKNPFLIPDTAYDEKFLSKPTLKHRVINRILRTLRLNYAN
ncbi:hypothetical protein N9P85_00590 [Amylibacter sp.]|nr:hypothetical protein [Amylibacter sp.]